MYLLLKMKNFKLSILILFIFSFETMSKIMLATHEDDERLTYKETFDEQRTHYIINTEESYQTLSKFTKDEQITSSGKYTYKWSEQDKNSYIDLKSKLPSPGSSGYVDFTIYETGLFKIIFCKKNRFYISYFILFRIN